MMTMMMFVIFDIEITVIVLNMPVKIKSESIATYYISVIGHAHFVLRWEAEAYARLLVICSTYPVVYVLYHHNCAKYVKFNLVMHLGLVLNFGLLGDILFKADMAASV